MRAIFVSAVILFLWATSALAAMPPGELATTTNPISPEPWGTPRARVTALMLGAELVGTPPAVETPTTPAAGASTRHRSADETQLSLGVLVFGLIVIVLEVIPLLIGKRVWGPDSTRIVILTLVVTAGVFLVTSGYSESQIAGVVGLLGTIVGYLLGKSERAHPEADKNGTEQQKEQ